MHVWRGGRPSTPSNIISGCPNKGRTGDAHPVAGRRILQGQSRRWGICRCSYVKYPCPRLSANSHRIHGRPGYKPSAPSISGRDEHLPDTTRGAAQRSDRKREAPRNGRPCGRRRSGSEERRRRAAVRARSVLLDLDRMWAIWPIFAIKLGPDDALKQRGPRMISSRLPDRAGRRYTTMCTSRSGSVISADRWAVRRREPVARRRRKMTSYSGARHDGST